MLRFKKSVFSTVYVSNNVIVVYELVRMCKKWLWPVLSVVPLFALTD